MTSFWSIFSVTESRAKKSPTSMERNTATWVLAGNSSSSSRTNSSRFRSTTSFFRPCTSWSSPRVSGGGRITGGRRGGRRRRGPPRRAAGAPGAAPAAGSPPAARRPVTEPELPWRQGRLDCRRGAAGAPASWRRRSRGTRQSARARRLHQPASQRTPRAGCASLTDADDAT